MSDGNVFAVSYFHRFSKYLTILFIIRLAESILLRQKSFVCSLKSLEKNTLS